jgi:hypothetical protein
MHFIRGHGRSPIVHDGISNSSWVCVRDSVLDLNLNSDLRTSHVCLLLRSTFE